LYIPPHQQIPIMNHTQPSDAACCSLTNYQPTTQYINGSDTCINITAVASVEVRVCVVEW
jgi:hypothetical protein